jgi:hypothetical protein
LIYLIKISLRGVVLPYDGKEKNIVIFAENIIGSSQDYAIRLALGNLHEHEMKWQ